MPFKTVGIVGTGVIGASWAGLFLSQGLKVLCSAPRAESEQKLAAHLKAIWPVLEKIGLAPGASLENYHFVGATFDGYYEQLDFIQESAPERLELKTKLLGQLDAGARPETIIASSSSGLPSSTFVGACKNAPERILIGHPFNPPHLMPLVEVVPHPGSSKAAIEQAIKFYEFIGKTPVLVKKETPGFVANRLQAALCNEAYSLVTHGIMSAADVDKCMTTSLGIRYAFTGPFMSNAFGGGGGPDGFTQMYKNIGPGMQVWLEDMHDKNYEWTDGNLQILNESVQEELKLLDIDTVVKERDELTIKLIRDKRGATAIV